MRTVVVFTVLVIVTSVTNAQWEQRTDGIVRCFTIMGTYLFAGTDGAGVNCSTNDGTDWIQVSSGLRNGYVWSFAVIGAPPYPCSIHKGENLFAGTAGGVFLSTNRGASWTAMDTGLTNSFVLALAVMGVNLFAGTADGVFLTNNNGARWARVDSGLTNTLVNALAVGGSYLFAGTGDGVFLSTNNGTSWTAASSGMPPSTLVYALAACGTNLFAGTEGGGVFLSTNNGTNWTAINAGLSKSSITSFAPAGTSLFTGTSGGGVFLSAHSSTAWTPVNNGLTNTTVLALIVSGTNLFAGTYGSGIWRRPVSQMVAVDESPFSLPEQFSFEQNYPNPFNPTTTIHYGLPQSSFVTLTIYNTLGQQVAQLVNERQQAGYHDAVFRGDRLASGVYFCRIQAGDFVASKKLLLLK